jgi:hypothetical protein
MPISDAITFDKSRNFGKFLSAEIVGAAYWFQSVVNRARASGELASTIAGALSGEVTPAKLQPLAEGLLQAGNALTAPASGFQPDALRRLGLDFYDDLPAPCVRGAIRMTPTTKDLAQRLSLVVGQRDYPLVCNDDALESFAGDLSAFMTSYDVAVYGWPDGYGQIFVEESAPVLSDPDIAFTDWAQGRLFDNGVKDGPVSLRVNARRQIVLNDASMQERLRPFIGTGVVLYGNREWRADGAITLSSIKPQLWFLTRLTNPPDPTVAYNGAPRPQLVGDRALCIGATPPWNWSGANIETHILAPQIAAYLAQTEERRVVYGAPRADLPEGWPNPVNHVTRVIDATWVADLPINSAAHFGARLSPRGALIRGIRGIAELTSAEIAFKG